MNKIKKLESKIIKIEKSILEKSFLEINFESETLVIKESKSLKLILNKFL